MQLVFRSNQMIHALSARLWQTAMPRRAMVNHLLILSTREHGTFRTTALTEMMTRC
jgi:hypothetical protein